MTKKPYKKPDYILDKFPGYMDIAHTYGYKPIETPEFFKNKSKIKSELLDNLLSFLYFYFKNDLYKKESQPLFYTYELPFKKSGKRKSSKNIEFELHTIGSLQSISDAIAIQTTLATLEDYGYDNLYVEINSVGDKDSYTKLEKDLISYYRKNINILPANLRQLFKKDIWNIIRCTDPKATNFLANAPKPLNSLSDISRKHFKEVLEFLETLEIPYVLNPSLIGEKGITVHTIFEVKTKSKSAKNGTVLAKGNRYDHISRELNFRRDTAGLRVEISFPKKKAVKDILLSKKKKAKLFFVQLGFEAKLHSLGILEMLRKKNINITHAISKDKITEQMHYAERLCVPYILILGQREALEKSIVIRDMQTRSQKTIPLDGLIDYIKAIK